MKKNRKHIWIKVILPLILVVCTALYYNTPHLKFKDLLLVTECSSSLKMDQVVLMATNRGVVNEKGELTISDKLSDNGELSYFLAKEQDSSFEMCQSGNLRTMLQSLPNKNLVVYVHGDGNKVEKNLWRSFLVKDEYDVNLLLFNWPSRDPELNGRANFINSMKVAENSADEFAMFLSELNDLKVAGELDRFGNNILFLHSLGNYLLEVAVEENYLNELPESLFKTVVINAAAVNSEHHSEWLEKLSIQEDVFVVSNSHDVNLQGAQYFTPAELLLGRKVEGKKVLNVEYIDVSKVMGFTFKRSPSHTYFVGDGLSKKNIKGFYHCLLDSPELDWKQYGKKNSELGVFEINEESS